MRLAKKNADDLLVLSYNILLSNSSDGWWVPKYYDPREPDLYWQWEYRKRLLNEQLTACGADFLVLQETSPESFARDFDFLFPHYDGLCHKKARISCATFWRKESFSLLASYHRDRTLITIFQNHREEIIALVNCHLSAGSKPRRRFQQIYAACEQLRKAKQQWDISLVVLAGDFNEHPMKTAIWQFLANGSIDEEFREERYPDTVISSRYKEQRIGRFVDCYEDARIDTMWVRNVVPLLQQDGLWTDSFITALEQLFVRFSVAETMTMSELEKWITEINGGLRGSEYREALKRVENGVLSKENFIAVHQQEVVEGKHWAVYYYLMRFGLSSFLEMPNVHSFCLDRIWYFSETYTCAETLLSVPEATQKLIRDGEYPPNHWHPSDHFPLGARFQRMEPLAYTE